MLLRRLKISGETALYVAWEVEPRQNGNKYSWGVQYQVGEKLLAGIVKKSHKTVFLSSL